MEGIDVASGTQLQLQRWRTDRMIWLRRKANIDLGLNKELVVIVVMVVLG